MKELTVSEIQEVNGGGAGESAAAFGLGMGIGAAVYGTKFASLGVAAAFALSPVGGIAMLGLSFYAGYILLR
ncbi:MULTISPECIES: hypothetical protein [Rheinheimera]|uniref:hypothetical protein n=1 Tax=Rheinheimera TaxID=67575 RepID=UPI001E5A4869|nr:MULTISPECIES: hypothetical protein [Rheinheimera]HJS16190.1 hypothetical protein [Rheinheimera sp.]